MDKSHKIKRVSINGVTIYAVGRDSATFVNGTLVFADGSVVLVEQRQIVNTKPELPITFDNPPDGFEAKKPETKVYGDAKMIHLKGIGQKVEVRLAADNKVKVLAHEAVDSRQEGNVIFVEGDGGSDDVIIIQTGSMAVSANRIFSARSIQSINMISTEDETEPVVVYAPKGTRLVFNQVEHFSAEDIGGSCRIESSEDATGTLGHVTDLTANVQGDLTLTLAGVSGEANVNVAGDANVKFGDVSDEIGLNAGGDARVSFGNAGGTVQIHANGDNRVSFKKTDKVSATLGASGDLNVSIDEGFVSSMALSANGDLRARLRVTARSLSANASGDLDLKLKQYINKPLIRASGDKDVEYGDW